MLTFHVIPLFLVIASEAWNLKVCACADDFTILWGLRSASVQNDQNVNDYLVPCLGVFDKDKKWVSLVYDPR